MAGVEGFEPSAHGFGDRCSTSWAKPLNWWTFRDSNPGPAGYEPDALTNWAKGPHCGGEGGIWTLAPRKLGPTPLAGEPLQPLEYFSKNIKLFDSA